MQPARITTRQQAPLALASLGQQKNQTPQALGSTGLAEESSILKCLKEVGHVAHPRNPSHTERLQVSAQPWLHKT